MEISENKIKIVGTANIPRGLDLDKRVDLTIANVDVVDYSNPVNDDGTKNQVFKLKISEISEINIIGIKEIIRAKKKGSQAKLLRWKLQQLAEKLDEEPEYFYQERMSEIIKKIEEEIEF